MKTRQLLTLLSLLAAVGMPHLASGQGLKISTVDQREVEITYQGKRLLLYACQPGQFKPYVKELYTLAGQNVLRDAPADHLHHHALMYAITVNGVNFWEEATAPGVQRAVGNVRVQSHTRTPGFPEAMLTHTLHWVAPTNRAAKATELLALLVERRTITLTLNEAAQEVAVHWQSEFEVGKGAAVVKLTGSDYHGLGLRFPVALDKVARHQNSENAPYLTQGKRDVMTAKWNAVSHELEGRAVMIAVFGRPSANAGPSTFFTMQEPFTYVSATQGLDQAPLEYKAGETFSVNYLVAVYPAHKSPAFLQQRFDQWMAKPIAK